jgi:hypothetical protein
MQLSLRTNHCAIQKKTMLLKAAWRGFLTCCPNINKKLILKYLNPCPATAEGHMKRPRHGICSITPKMPTIGIAPIPVIPVLLLHVCHFSSSPHPPPYQGPAYGTLQSPNLIEMNDHESITNVFCFGAFGDKNNRVVYNDLMGSFPFISLEGSVCFFVLYHYKAHAILVMPIAGLDDISIFNAYEMQFKGLALKGFKPKVNIMDNQATKHIKEAFILIEQQCKLQLIEPHNHTMNAAERAIQTFMDAFITALTTTNSEFPVQLWDKIMPQVQDTLNMMQALRIKPSYLRL